METASIEGAPSIQAALRDDASPSPASTAPRETPPSPSSAAAQIAAAEANLSALHAFKSDLARDLEGIERLAGPNQDPVRGSRARTRRSDESTGPVEGPVEGHEVEPEAPGAAE